MKTRCYFYAAALLLLAGCTAENLPEENAGAPVPIGVAVTVTEPAGTRAASNIQDAKFDAGEAFYVQFAASKATVNNATYTTTATGLATLSSATQPYFQTGESSVTLNAFYPYVTGKLVTETTTSFSVEQDQSSAANYKKSDLMFATATVTKSGTSVTAPLNFSHKMAKIQVIANAGTGVSNITAVSIVGGNRTVALSGGNATLGVLSNALSDGSPLTMYSDVTGAQSVNCAALLPPQDITNSNFIKVTTASDGAAVYRITKTLASGNTYTMVLDIDKSALGNTTIITGWNSENMLTVTPTTVLTLPDHTPTGVLAIDIGLSVKWANMNIGAYKITDMGAYFAWGEVAGHSGLISSGTTMADGYNYGWPTTPYNGGSNEFNATKYTSTDGRTQLEPWDDAAYMNWGGNWRMPTIAEETELYDTYNKNEWGSDNATKWKWIWQTDYQGVSGCNGYLISYRASTANTTVTSSIFLPAAGYRYGTSVNDLGSYGYYWSSALNAGSPYRARWLFFYSTEADVGNDSRFYGFSVRAVLSN